MKPPKSAWLIAIVLLHSELSFGAELNLRTEVQENKSFLGFGAESSNFRLDTGSISGTGVKIDFSHYFSPKFSFQVHLTSGLGGGGSFTSNYTGLGGYISYAILGNCCATESLTSIGGQPTLIESYTFGNSFNVGVGMDQYMLYGESSVYSASGAGILANYQFNLWNFRWKLEGKNSFLSINSKQVQGLSLGLSLLFSI